MEKDKKSNQELLKESEERYRDEALRESEEKYRRIIETANEGIWIVDAKTRATYVNKKMAEMLGYTPEEMIGKMTSDFLEKNEKDIPLQYIKKREKGQAEKFEIKFLCKDGSPLWVLVSASPIFDKDNKFCGSFGMLSDITERKHAEEELYQSQNYLENLLDYANAPIIVWDPDFKITRFNHAFERMTGLNSADVLGKKLDILFPPDSREHSRQHIISTISGQRWETVEIPILHRDGSIRIALWNSATLFDADRKTIIATIAQGQDITERKHAEEELHKLNRTLRALSESNQALMHAENESAFLQEVCRIIVEVCGHSMVWIGFKDDEAKTVKPVAQSGFDDGYINTLNITWADSERGQGPTGTAVRTGKIAMCRNMLTDPKFAPWRQEALKRGYASSIVLPLISEGEIFGAITIYSKEADPFSEHEIKLLEELANDLAYGIIMLRMRVKNAEAEEILRRDKDTLEKLVADRSQDLLDAQLELERTKRLSDIGTLAATVAHELRNPLAAIGIATYNIKRMANNPDIEKHLVNINMKVDESDQIIDNLLFYSRIKPPHYEKINIYEILVECAEALEKNVKKELRIIKNFDSIKDNIIEADPVQIKEVFNNILNNAYDAVPADIGEIRIISEIEDEYITIYIEDNGPGISDKIIDKLFDPFFSTKAKGTGLGLSVCKQIVIMHDGEIDVKNKPTKGACFFVRLPKERKEKKGRISG